MTEQTPAEPLSDDRLRQLRILVSDDVSGFSNEAVASLLARLDQAEADRDRLRRQLDAAEAQPALRADLTRYTFGIARADGTLAIWCTDCDDHRDAPIWTEDDATEQITELSVANLVAVAEQHEREHHDKAEP